ncbi:MAG: hypothetical protein JNN08_11760, partial [Bryobacterales bacterium]|nr:hypothetical protein [Bryobacterales bacterium]
MQLALELISLALAGLLAGRRAVRALHMWQMDSYIASRYIDWLVSKPLERYLDLPALALLAASLFVPVTFIYPAWIAWALYQLVRKDTTP